MIPGLRLCGFDDPRRSGAGWADPLEGGARPSGRIFPDGIRLMVKITYIDSAESARTIDAEVGATVMETAIKNDVPGIDAECGGACACATCHVYIDEAWREKVGGPTPMEEDMLDFGYDVRPNSRLSCQIKVSEELDGLIVRTPERQA
jgi:2Fe-2S ferredoxin